MREVRRVACPLAFGLFLAGAFHTSAAAAPELSFDDEAPPAVEEALSPDDASSGAEASEVVKRFARWVIASDDHAGRPFAVVDKVRARVFVYDSRGRLSGSAPVLIGSAMSDETSPEVGELELVHIPPDMRTTGAGRFDAYLGAAKGEAPEVLWLDYDSGLSLHPVITGNKKQQRLRRLATATPLDNRITFGCINVPADFYQEVVRTAFERRGAVYILPETRDLEAVFPDFRWNRRDRNFVAAAAGPDAKQANSRSGKHEPEKLSTLLGF